MKAFAIAIVGAIVLIVAIAAYAPASLLDARIAAATLDSVRLSDAQGTLWEGQGTLSASDGRWRLPVAWTLEKQPLLRGAAAIRFASSDEAATDIRGRVRASNDRIVIESLEATLPGALFGAVARNFGTATGGEVDVRLANLVLGPDAGNGETIIDWRDARLYVAGLVADLGTVNARLALRGDTLSGPITSRGGAVVVDGTLSIDDQRFAAQIRMTPQAGASPALRKALESIGPADARGAITLRVDRSLR